MLKTSPKEHTVPARCFSQWLGMAGLMGTIWFGTLCAAEDSRSKIARLGFAFDQRAHDAAVAADKARADLERENDEQVILSDGVIRLPKYYVNEERMPFNKREILTPEGRLAVAKKRYISPVYAKTLGPLSAVASLLANPLGGWQPNDPEAMTLYYDQDQKRRNAEMKELIKLDAAGR
jgi:hypothetical protein